MEEHATSSPPKQKRSFKARFWRGLIYALAVVGAVNVVTAVVTVVLFVGHGPKPIPEHVILELDLEAALGEQSTSSPVELLLHGKSVPVLSVVTSLQRAATDSRVVGLVAHVGQAELGTAVVQELRDAIAHFRAQKKFAVAWSEGFGDGGDATTPYYLSTAFDTIYLLPSGDLDLGGLATEQVFAKGLLDRLHIAPRIERREQYKTAFNQLTERGFTEDHRAATLGVLSSLYDQMLRGIAKDRKLDRQALTRLAQLRLHSAKEAQQARLVDRLAYRDEVYAAVKQRAGGQPTLLYLSAYRERLKTPLDAKKSIAMIYAVGTITRTQGGFSPLYGTSSVAADTVTAAFRSAVGDKDVGCILFRVNSPGGSYIASDMLWRAVTLARAAGKPVICSMGNVAASGGYLAAAPATTIVAEPGTLTGSIGVLGGKLQLTDAFWEQLGLRYETLETEDNAGMWSIHQDFNPHQRARFAQMIDRVYDDFVSKVARGRKLTPQAARDAAKGRVFTGEQAKQRGLVDELGGIATAIQLCKRAAGIDPEQTARLVSYPREKGLLESTLELLRDEGKDSSEDDDLKSTAGLSMTERRQLAALRTLLLQARMAEAGGALAAPELVPFL